MPIHNSGETLKRRPSLSAISALTPRLRRIDGIEPWVRVCKRLFWVFRLAPADIYDTLKP